MSLSEPDDPWYRDGLAFECTRCGACCTGAPGYVWVDRRGDRPAGRAPRRDGRRSSRRRYVRRVGDRYSLIEKPGGDCIFWDKQAGCTVYPARPVQCQTWPFWPENLETPEDWEHVDAVCPGSGAGPAGSASRRSRRRPPRGPLMITAPTSRPARTRRRRFRDALRALYAELDAEVAAARARSAELSGRCCRFAEYDHTLFLSAPEAALLLADAPPPSRPLDDGATCPWQDARGPLHGARGPAAGLPRLLLRPRLSGATPRR